MRLKDKVCIVTGAASGIGRATAGVLADEGAVLMLADLNADGLKETQSEVVAKGGRAEIVGTDVSQTEDVRRLIEATRQAYSRLDVLVNCAGISELSDVAITEVSEEVFDRTIAVNLRSMFLTCKYAIPLMKESGGGSIVNLSSIGGLFGMGGTAYTASKGGVLSITRAIAYQYAAEGIRCNAICPGATDTPMIQVSMQKLGVNRATVRPGTIPRMAQPEEIGYLIAFLASDQAAFITGATYTVDGGALQH